MNKNKRVDTIIFDYDGTLHDSSHLYIPAFKKAYRFLVKEGQVEEKQFSDEDITKWLGYTKEEMWGTFQSELPTEYKEKASAMIGLK
ncbi:HAD family hydrolase [Marinilactibacillus kalidii]|uniref:HAD family hydrolase n=1 Tax=Marinilactibacillus kalidii TaxID=2820274 RepID=UPI001ABDEA9B|nr:HAD hydrolase-like protein [Marinilactibacillus kalidii]